MTKTLSKKQAYLPELTLYSKSATSGRYPRSFGAFFGSSYYDHTKSFHQEFIVVCQLNKWNPSRFKTFTSMIRWLLSNNATRESIEAVLDVACYHSSKANTYNSYSEHAFLDDYFDSKYVKGIEFDFSTLPKHTKECVEF